MNLGLDLDLVLDLVADVTIADAIAGSAVVITAFVVIVSGSGSECESGCESKLGSRCGFGFNSRSGS